MAVLPMGQRQRLAIDDHGIIWVPSIRGRRTRGALVAQRCAPHIPRANELDTLCRRGQYPDSGDALLGSFAVLTQPTPEMARAELLNPSRNPSKIAFDAAALVSTDPRGGRFQRRAAGELSVKEFKRFSQRIRPPIQNVCGPCESGLSPAGRRRVDSPECGVGLCGYRDTRHIG